MSGWGQLQTTPRQRSLHFRQIGSKRKRVVIRFHVNCFAGRQDEFGEYRKKIHEHTLW